MKRILIKGFTIVELLVVISIIIVLLGILVPSLIAFRERGRTIVCAANLRNFGFAIEIYMHDNNGWLPAAEPLNKDDATNQDNWYLNPELLTCMDITTAQDANGLIVDPLSAGKILVCPSHFSPMLTRPVLPDFPEKQRPFSLSYMMNGTWRLSNRGGRTGSYRHISEFRRPCKTITICDGNGYERARGIVFYEACPSHNFEYRHQYKINVLYLDKHTGLLKKDDVPMGRKSRYDNFWSEKKTRK